jgi:ATP-binding cassette, subfamily B, bacterial PglK
VKNLYQALQRLLPLLPAGARRFLVGYSAASASLAILDIAALGLLALVMTPMLAGDPVTLPFVGTVAPSGYIWILLAVCALIILKSLLSLLLRWIATRRFADYEMEIGDRLFTSYLHAPWTDRVSRSSAELVRLADVGIANTTSGLLLPAASLPTEIATFAAVMVVLLVAQPTTALITILYLGLLAGLLYFVISPRALVAGRVNRDFSFRVATLMTEMVATLKEITLRNKLSEVADVVHRNRSRAVRARANSQFLGQAPKYVLEIALIGGFLLVGGVGYLQGGSEQAFAAVAMFAVAGFRMIPSVTRFQGIMTQTASTLPHANRVIYDIETSNRYVVEAEELGREPLVARPRELVLEDVSFAYPTTAEPAVHDLDLTIRMGTHVALVGASGAGKSTLVDLLLGLLRPSSGSIRIDQQDLAAVLADWRNSVGYVPQDVALFDGSVAQNVALSWDSAVDEARVRQCLARAQLLDVVESRGGIGTRAGERGLAFSGGQRQRLGIARALYTDPLVLVMDEATSALDTSTEDAVTRAIRELHGEVTVITVAHRLSTVLNADQVCFMEGGTIRARGTFEEVVAAAPAFAEQARLAGLA